MVALYRPGPMEWIPEYIAGKLGRKKPKYLHPKLEPILKKTYGVAIYQEQVMQMARVMAGFTMAEADVLRKAVGKKIPKLLAEQKEKFIDGCVKNGVSSQLAETIFSFIEPFAGYGFNRSHAACYALIAYQTAYLKAGWPTEFMAALLTSDQGDTDRIAIEIDECRRVGIEVMAPDLNESYGSFTVVTSGTAENRVVSAEEKITKIRFGLKAIKNIGGNIADEIIKERKTHGPFIDITDLLERVTDKDLNKKSLESLIKCGALDRFGARGMLLANMEAMLSFNKEVSKNALSNQSSLFALQPSVMAKNKVKLTPATDASQAEKLGWEKELLGLYISEHPFNDYKKLLAGLITPIAELKTVPRDSNVTIGGVVSSLKKIITRSNETMLFVKIEDQLANVELLVFPSLLKVTGEIWQTGKVVLCYGRLSDKDQEVKLLLGKAVELPLVNISEAIEKFKNTKETGGRSANGNGYNNNYANGNGYGGYTSPKKAAQTREPAAPPQSLKIIFEKELRPEALSALKELLINHTGNDKVYFKISTPDGAQVIETGFRVDKNQELLAAIRSIGGGEITVLDN
jgi:DNA polymerase-3 subunit alpha